MCKNGVRTWKHETRSVFCNNNIEFLESAIKQRQTSIEMWQAHPNKEKNLKSHSYPLMQTLTHTCASSTHILGGAQVYLAVQLLKGRHWKLSLYLSNCVVFVRLCGKMNPLVTGKMQVHGIRNALSHIDLVGGLTRPACLGCPGL